MAGMVKKFQTVYPEVLHKTRPTRNVRSRVYNYTQSNMQAFRVVKQIKTLLRVLVAHCRTTNIM